MPKRVDREARRREIVGALFRVAVRDGLAAVSIRSVAAEARIPPSRVQYYFSSKAGLIEAALVVLTDRLVGRGLALQQAAGPDASPQALVRAAVTGAQPIDEDARESLVLYFLFFVAAITGSPTNATTRLVTSQRFIVDYFTGLIRHAQARGDADPELDALREARLILFANIGLTLGVLAGIHTRDDAIAAMDDQIAHIFT